MEPLDPNLRPSHHLSDPWIGRTLAEKYRIEDLIAAGGMGRVYRAVQEPLGRQVAVKILSPRTTDAKLNREFKKRFFREAATCARLQHPNTVTLFDYGEFDQDTVYMVMELVQGRTREEPASRVAPPGRRPVAAPSPTKSPCRCARPIASASSIGI